MGTGTLDLTRVEEERRRLEEHRRPEDEDPATVAERIVEEVLAAEASLDERLKREEDARDGAEPARRRMRRRDLVLLGTDDPLVLLPGPAYEPDSAPFAPLPDDLELLVEDAITSLRAEPRTLGEALRTAADSPAMPATRWMLFGLLWMVAFAGLVPFAVATIGNALEVEVDLFAEEEEEPAIEQIAPEGSDETENPSVEDEGS